MFSADHGLTWERLEGPVSSGLNEVTGDPDQVWAVGDNGVILNFRFGAKRGELVPSGTTAKLSSIARLGRRSLMVVSDDGDILISQTNGTSWSPLPRVTTNPLKKVIVSDNTIWVFGASGTILAADLR
jgi:photosystem II stability/assembly factor-like uncharacterized protein